MSTDLTLGGTPTDLAGVNLGSVCEMADGCITCGDVAVILTVLSTDASHAADALCRDNEGRTERVAVELVGAVTPGDRLLVHAGVALELLNGNGGA